MWIDLHTITWNERRMLPFFLAHHESWVDRFVVFDDQSDDGTAQALARHPKVDLRPFPPKGESFVLAALALWQHAWKESRGRADWVVLSNVDEFFHHPAGMRAYLERCTAEGVTIIHPRGYEMVGERFPEPGSSLVRRVPTGVAMFGQDKRQLFDPDAITEINFEPGRHACMPTGTVVEPATVEAMLLHYKYVDPHAYTLPRQKALGQRMLPADRSRGFGMQYGLTNEQLLNSFRWLTMHATHVVSAEPGAPQPAGGPAAAV
jgi:hypothetical protein